MLDEQQKSMLADDAAQHKDIKEITLNIDGVEQHLHALREDQLKALLVEKYKCQGDEIESISEKSDLMDRILEEYFKPTIVLGDNNVQNLVNHPQGYEGLVGLLKQYFCYTDDKIRSEQIKNARDCRYAIAINNEKRKKGFVFSHELAVKDGGKSGAKKEKKLSAKKAKKKAAKRKKRRERADAYCDTFTLDQLQKILQRRYKYDLTDIKENYATSEEVSQEIVKNETWRFRCCIASIIVALILFLLGLVGVIVFILAANAYGFIWLFILFALAVIIAIVVSIVGYRDAVSKRKSIYHAQEYAGGAKDDEIIRKLEIEAEREETKKEDRIILALSGSVFCTVCCGLASFCAWCCIGCCCKTCCDTSDADCECGGGECDCCGCECDGCNIM